MTPHPTALDLDGILAKGGVDRGDIPAAEFGRAERFYTAIRVHDARLLGALDGPARFLGERRTSFSTTRLVFAFDVDGVEIDLGAFTTDDFALAGRMLDQISATPGSGICCTRPADSRTTRRGSWSPTPGSARNSMGCRARKRPAPDHPGRLRGLGRAAGCDQRPVRAELLPS